MHHLALCSIKSATGTAQNNTSSEAMWHHGEPGLHSQAATSPAQHSTCAACNCTLFTPMCCTPGRPPCSATNSAGHGPFGAPHTAHTWPLGLLEHMPTLLVEHRVDAAQRLLRGLDLNQVDGLAQARPGCELRGVQGSPAGGDDLATTPVDGVCMKYHIAHLQGKSRRHTVCGQPDTDALLVLQLSLSPWWPVFQLPAGVRHSTGLPHDVCQCHGAKS